MSKFLIISDIKSYKDNENSINEVQISPTVMIAKHAVVDYKAQSKKQALREASNIAEKEYGLSSKVCFESLLEREKLGSTGLGNGIAIPHGKFEDINKLYAVFLRLNKPINYEAVDGMPVDLVFTLLAPSNQNSTNLKALSHVTRFLGETEVRNRIRGASSIDAIIALLTEAK